MSIENISGLPYEIIVHIASFFGSVSYIALRSTASRFHNTLGIQPYRRDTYRELGKQRLVLIQWFFQQHSHIHPIAIDEICKGAIARGAIDVIAWCFAQNGNTKKNSQLCETAAETGNLDLLKWLRSNVWDERACTRAARNGHLEVLKWARTNGCPWDKCRMTLYKNGVSSGDFVSLANAQTGVSSIGQDFSVGDYMNLVITAGTAETPVGSAILVLVWVFKIFFCYIKNTMNQFVKLPNASIRLNKNHIIGVWLSKPSVFNPKYTLNIQLTSHDGNFMFGSGDFSNQIATVYFDKEKEAEDWIETHIDHSKYADKIY